MKTLNHFINRIKGGRLTALEVRDLFVFMRRNPHYATILLEFIETNKPAVRDKNLQSWLRLQHYAPSGAIRSNSPFNKTQVAIVKYFTHNTLTGCHDIGDGYIIPVFTVNCTKGASFMYYVSAGKAVVIP